MNNRHEAKDSQVAIAVYDIVCTVDDNCGRNSAQHYFLEVLNTVRNSKMYTCTLLYISSQANLVPSEAIWPFCL